MTFNKARKPVPPCCRGPRRAIPPLHVTQDRAKSGSGKPAFSRISSPSFPKRRLGIDLQQSQIERPCPHNAPRPRQIEITFITLCPLSPYGSGPCQAPSSPASSEGAEWCGDFAPSGLRSLAPNHTQGVALGYHMMPFQGFRTAVGRRLPRCWEMNQGTSQKLGRLPPFRGRAPVDPSPAARRRRPFDCGGLTPLFKEARRAAPAPKIREALGSRRTAPPEAPVAARKGIDGAGSKSQNRPGQERRQHPGDFTSLRRASRSLTCGPK